MILVDLNQVLLSGLMAQISNQKGVKLDESLVRHMILNILRMHIRNFRKDYGDVVLCCDNRKYWRKEYFPFYKAGRKKTREKSDLDWHLIFDMLAKFKSELRENFPYKVIDVEGAELEVLLGADLQKFKPKLILLEDKHLYLVKHRFLLKAGYVLAQRHNRNCWYVKRGEVLPRVAFSQRFKLWKRMYVSIWVKKIAYAIRHRTIKPFLVF